MKNFFLVVLFLIGLLLVLTFDVQLTLGVVFMIVGYDALRRRGISVSQYDDVVHDLVKKYLNE